MITEFYGKVIYEVESNGKTVKSGDKISACGITVEIAKILNAEWWDRYGWDIECIDINGEYHHWKQYEDGGKLKKKLVDCYGSDVTDLFRKYGYNV